MFEMSLCILREDNTGAFENRVMRCDKLHLLVVKRLIYLYWANRKYFFQTKSQALALKQKIFSCPLLIILKSALFSGLRVYELKFRSKKDNGIIFFQ